MLGRVSGDRRENPSAKIQNHIHWMHRGVRYIRKKTKNRCAPVAGTGRRWVANGVEVGGWSAIGRCRPGARVLAPFALTRIQVVWISVWVNLSVCCTFETLRSGRDMCARIQKMETIEPAVIRSAYIEKIVTPLLRRRIRKARQYNRRMWRDSLMVFNPLLDSLPWVCLIYLGFSN